VVTPTSKDLPRIVIKDELSQCSFKVNINNECSQCTKNEDCGVYSAVKRKGLYWYEILPVCKEGLCYWRRIITKDNF
jgi:hypothetical protein